MNRLKRRLYECMCYIIRASIFSQLNMLHFMSVHDFVLSAWLHPGRIASGMSIRQREGGRRLFPGLASPLNSSPDHTYYLRGRLHCFLPTIDIRSHRLRPPGLNAGASRIGHQAFCLKRRIRRLAARSVQSRCFVWLVLFCSCFRSSQRSFQRSNTAHLSSKSHTKTPYRKKQGSDTSSDTTNSCYIRTAECMRDCRFITATSIGKQRLERRVGNKAHDLVFYLL